MCIYLSDNAIFVLIFITGLVLGAIVHRIITAPRKTTKPIDYYDGTHGMGYSPIANNEKPWARPPLSTSSPPKPDYNPNK